MGASNDAASYAWRAAIGDASWTSLPNVGIAAANTVLSTHDGYIWIGGSFTQTVDAAVQANRVIRYNIDADTFEALDAGFNGTVYQLFQGRDGYVYAMGGFSMDGDNNYDLRGMARWNGSTWEEVFEVASIPTAPTAAFDANGVLWYADFGVIVATQPYGDQYMQGWSNGVHFPQMFVQPADASGIRTFAFNAQNEMLASVTLSSATNTLAPKQYTLTNGGDADALPVIILRNAQRIRFVQNLDAGTGLYFREGFALQNNDRLFIDMRGNRPHIHSDARHSLLRHIHTGASNLASFVLRPGINKISILCTDADASVQNSLVWRNRFLSSDAVVSL